MTNKDYMLILIMILSAAIVAIKLDMWWILILGYVFAYTIYRENRK